MEETPAEEITIETKKYVLPAWARYVFFALPALVVVVFMILSGWGGYTFTYVKCGLRQPLIAQTFQHSQIYYTSDNRRYSAPGEGPLFSGYYCTEPQAQKDGFLRAGP